MTEIVFKPEPGAKTVSGKGLYRAYLNKKPLDLLCRARNAGQADEMLQYLFESQTSGKTLDYDINTFKENDNGEEDEDGKRP